ncbi:hypothetical protein [Gordonia sp. MP11Mi]|uniref:Uncharacterized protein n=1 Tax=Gordonia sp. MP11Mi TaxID=3022769 RepID=A0AA97CXL1_9ACTN
MYDLAATMDAISILLDVERSPRLSGAVVTKKWYSGRPDLEPMVGRHHFVVDRDEDTWSLSDDNRRFVDVLRPDGRRQYLIRDHVEDLPAGVSVPDEIRLLFPASELEIWGRTADTWRMVGAETVEGGYLVHIAHPRSKASYREIFIDTELRLPTRLTTVRYLHPKEEIVLSDVRVDGEWAGYVYVNEPQVGTLMASFPVKRRDHGPL